MRIVTIIMTIIRTIVIQHNCILIIVVRYSVLRMTLETWRCGDAVARYLSAPKNCRQYIHEQWVSLAFSHYGNPSKSWNLPEAQRILLGTKSFGHHIPSGNFTIFYIAIENGPVEIVSFPINSMVIFHCYVAVYQRVTTLLLSIFIPFWY